MSGTTTIEWTDATWNPVTGCTKISAGCDNCYAERFSERFRGTPGHPFENGFDLILRPERLEQPLQWRRSKMIFVNSMSDLFHKEIPDQFIARVFDTMEDAFRADAPAIILYNTRRVTALRAGVSGFHNWPGQTQRLWNVGLEAR